MREVSIVYYGHADTFTGGWCYCNDKDAALLEAVDVWKLVSAVPPNINVNLYQNSCGADEMLRRL